jgi:hypothetical protein
MEAEVALIANPAAPFKPGPIDASFYAQPYSQRRRVTLEVEEKESLASVLERAAATMNLRPPNDPWLGGHFDAAHRKIAFYKQADENGPIRRSKGRLLLGELTVVDRDGHAIFGVHDLRTVRVSDLLRSAEAGTIEGDPLRPYLILDDGWGDAPPADWATVHAGLEVAWEVLKAAAVITGAATGAMKAREWLLERLGRSREALQANTEWAQRGYRPDQFESLLLTRTWQTAELAGLLGCTEEQAEGVLWTLGYAFNEEDGTWESDEAEGGEIMRAIVTGIGYAAHTGGDWEARFQAWMSRFIEEGEPPPLETLDPEARNALVAQWTPTLGERIDALLARVRRIRPGR